MTNPGPGIPHAELYRMALDEYRFQIQLNWDRTKFFILVNASILAAAAALMRLDGSRVAEVLVVLLFLAGALVACLGIRVTAEGKRHHRAATVKKTLIEEAAGLVQGPSGREGDYATFALGAMASKSKTRRILADVDGYVTANVRRESITGAVTMLLWGMLVLDLLGALLVGRALMG